MYSNVSKLTYGDTIHSVDVYPPSQSYSVELYSK